MLSFTCAWLAHDRFGREADGTSGVITACSIRICAGAAQIPGIAAPNGRFGALFLSKKRFGMEEDMKEVTYQIPEGEAPQEFLLEWGSAGELLSCRHAQDPDQMNWFYGKNHWGTVRSELELSVQVVRSFTENGRLREEYRFRNDTDYDIYTYGTKLGICLPFADYYTDAATCMKHCCHTHLWCGGTESYVCALKMGKSSYNLGLILKEGDLRGYSVERDLEQSSNERGMFIVHPNPMTLRPGETAVIAWELFWFADKEAFRKLLEAEPGRISIQAANYVTMGKEPIRFRVQANGLEGETLRLYRDGEEIRCSWENGCAQVEDLPEKPGEHCYEVRMGEKRARAVFYQSEEAGALAAKRCRFLADRQQCEDTKSRLYGAYLIYDTEEQRQYYSHWHDHNGGRERVGMGVLLALALQRDGWEEETRARLRQSLEQYVSYVLRELFAEETGEVFNEAGRNRELKRPYNDPWVAVLFLELFALTGEKVHLERMIRCVRAYYREGGARFYAIGMPMLESVRVLRKEGMESEAAELLALYREHGEVIAGNGTSYPAHEVKYEQSIVAPAAIYLCELYLLTGEERWREAALQQLEVLDLFQGEQPDHHLNQVAIRHWDGYWFGKRQCYGDTFPHYWSALSGIACRRAAEIAAGQNPKDQEMAVYGRKAEQTLRGVLSLFGPDGSASCAMVYPMQINGIPGGYYDPWANDQDWGLYFYLKYGAVDKIS